MDNARKTACPENEEVAAYLLNKRHELAQSSKGISDNMDMTLSKAHSNICNYQNPIRNLKDLSQIKGVGKWILKQMQGFFPTDSGPSEIEDLTKNGNKNKGPKRYVPQKNSVAYALLITLFRGIETGNEFMHKKELIDAAETSGLSRVPIAPEKAKGKAGHFGSSPRDWYTGWNCMKTLISRGLVVKSSCPAKYMLTEEGKEVARECLSRSGMVCPNKKFDGLERCSGLAQRDKLGVVLQEDLPDLERVMGVSVAKAATNNVKKAKISVDIPPDYPRKGKDISSLDRLQEDHIYSLSSIPKSRTDDHHAPSLLFQLGDGRTGTNSSEMQRHANDASSNKKSLLHTFGWSSCTLKPCSSNNVQENVTSQLGFQGSETKPNSLATPPLAFGEKFGDVYEIVLILDNREQFAMQG